MAYLGVGSLIEDLRYSPIQAVDSADFFTDSVNVSLVSSVCRTQHKCGVNIQKLIREIYEAKRLSPGIRASISGCMKTPKEIIPLLFRLCASLFLFAFFILPRSFF